MDPAPHRTTDPEPRWTPRAVFAAPLAVATWLAVSVVWPAFVRMAHAVVRLGADERAARVTTHDGLTLRGGYRRGTSERAVLLVHGYVDGRRRWHAWAETLGAAGAHVARFDHRAHGTSGGAVVSFADREVDDVVAMARWLREQDGVARVSVLATSMGAGAALAASARLRELGVDRMVLLAPASDYPGLLRAASPALVTLLEPTLRRIARVVGRRSLLELVPRDAMGDSPLPTVVFHSRSDATVPASLSEAIVRAHPHVRVEWLDGVSHVDMPGAVLELHRDDALRALGVDRD